MSSKYITCEKFEDFNKNFGLLIQTFNHNITEMKDDNKEMKKDSKETAKQVTIMAKDLGEIKGKLSVTSKMVWWILGIIGVIVGAAILASL